MLPNSDDAPAIFTQNAVDPAVAGLVRGELLFPERTIASGNFAVLGAAVPKAAVHEERESRLPKEEIRLAENFLIPAPASDAILAEHVH